MFNYLWLIGEVMLITLLVGEFEFSHYGDIKYAVAFGVFGLAYYEMAWSGDTFHQVSVILGIACIQFLFQLDGYLMFMYLLPIALFALGLIRVGMSRLAVNGVSITTSCLYHNSSYIDISRLEELRCSRTWVGKKLNFGSIYIPIVGQHELKVVSGFSNVETLMNSIKNQIKTYEKDWL